MPISVVFDPPLPSDSPSTFNTKAFTLLGDLNDWSTQANALPGEFASDVAATLAAPPAIGGTTPAAGSFTTLSASGVATIQRSNLGFGSLQIGTGSTATDASEKTAAIFCSSDAASPGASPSGLLISYTGSASATDRRTNINTFTYGSGNAGVLGLHNGAVVIDNAGTVTIPGTLAVGEAISTLKITVPITDNSIFGINAYANNTVSSAIAGTINFKANETWTTTANGSYIQFRTVANGTTGLAELMRITGSGVEVTGGTLGYGTGAGGTVTQATSKSTAVTLNKPCGQITMVNSALGAGTSVYFAVYNSFYATTDLAVINVVGGIVSPDTYDVSVTPVSTGIFYVNLKNISAGPLSDSVVVGFAIIKGATS